MYGARPSPESRPVCRPGAAEVYAGPTPLTAAGYRIDLLPMCEAIHNLEFFFKPYVMSRPACSAHELCPASALGEPEGVGAVDAELGAGVQLKIAFPAGCAGACRDSGYGTAPITPELLVRNRPT